MKFEMNRMNRGRKPSTADQQSRDLQRRRSLTPTRPVFDLVQTFDGKSGQITRASSSSSSSSEDESKKVQVIVVHKRERPRKSSLVKPDRPRMKKQSNVSFAMQVGIFLSPCKPCVIVFYCVSPCFTVCHHEQKPFLSLTVFHRVLTVFWPCLTVFGRVLTVYWPCLTAF